MQNGQVGVEKEKILLNHHFNLILKCKKLTIKGIYLSKKSDVT